MSLPPVNKCEPTERGAKKYLKIKRSTRAPLLQEAKVDGWVGAAYLRWTARYTKAISHA